MHNDSDDGNSESCKMVATLQLKGWQRHAVLIYSLLLWYWTFMLWPPDVVKTRYLPTSITWPYHKLQFWAHWEHILFEVDRWPSTGFLLDHRQAHVHVYVGITGCKWGKFVWKPVNANPGCKVNRITGICILRLFKVKREGQTIYRKPHWKV